MNLNNLKYNFIIILILLMQNSCVKNQNASHSNRQHNCCENYAKDIMLKEKDYYITGNFNGNEKDTIFFHYYSHRLKRETNQIPSSDNNWDDIIHWFNDFQIETYFTYKKDTLKIGSTYGLYCLLNMGDINADGKDEIAFVADLLDYSRINSCNIYTICQSRFHLLKTFTINESAFDTPNSDTMDLFMGIHGFLEKKNNVWYYCSVDDDDVSNMKVLDIEKCH